MGYVVAAILAYLLGCSNMAIYIAKYKHVDLRAGGSGNPGASNATILMGWKAGVLVALHDIGKAYLAVLLAKLLFPGFPVVEEVAGIACVLGHIFPFYLKFKGGKGFASYLGMTLALNWRFALVVMITVLVVTLITDYIAVGTFTTIIVVPTYMGIITQSLLVAAVLCVGTAVIFYKHRENVVRIWKGTEIGLRSTARGEHRADK